MYHKIITNITFDSLDLSNRMEFFINEIMDYFTTPAAHHHSYTITAPSIISSVYLINAIENESKPSEATISNVASTSERNLPIMLLDSGAAATIMSATQAKALEVQANAEAKNIYIVLPDGGKFHLLTLDP